MTMAATAATPTEPVRRFFLILALLVAGGLPGLRASPPAATNELCPVTPEEWAEPNISATYQGKEVFFCCKRCRKQFLEDPATYLANLPQFAESSRRAVAPTTSPPEDEHDHKHDHGSPGEHSPSPDPTRFAGKLHPLAVHFPIALVLVTFAFELGYLVTRRRPLQDTASYLAPLAALSALGAALLGWAAGLHARYPGELVTTLLWHRRLGVATAVAAGVMGLLSLASRQGERPRVTLTYRLFLVTTAALVVATAHLGGTLIYGPDHFQW